MCGQIAKGDVDLVISVLRFPPAGDWDTGMGEDGRTAAARTQAAYEQKLHEVVLYLQFRAAASSAASAAGAVRFSQYPRSPRVAVLRAGLGSLHDFCWPLTASDIIRAGEILQDKHASQFTDAEFLFDCPRSTMTATLTQTHATLLSSPSPSRCVSFLDGLRAQDPLTITEVATVRPRTTQILRLEQVRNLSQCTPVCRRNA
jgi:hypothetical protein